MPSGAEGVISKKRRREEWRAAASSECHLDRLSTAALEETCTCFTINYLRIIRNNIFRTKQCQILYCTWRKKARVNARHLDYNLFHPMYLQKWSLIWLTAVEISQQSHNSPVIESRAVKYYSNKSSKSPLKNCPCSRISHNHKGGDWEKGSKRRGMIFPQREPQDEDPAHPNWWPNQGREAKKQRLWAIKKCCRKFHHGYSISKRSQPFPCNLLEQEWVGCSIPVVDPMNPACVEGRRWPLEEKSHRSQEVKVRSGMRALATWGGRRGKSK